MTILAKPFMAAIVESFLLHSRFMAHFYSSILLGTVAEISLQVARITTGVNTTVPYVSSNPYAPTKLHPRRIALLLHGSFLVLHTITSDISERSAGMYRHS